VALTWLTPPGWKRSKGTWALAGARGVYFVVASSSWNCEAPQVFCRSYAVVVPIDPAPASLVSSAR